MKVSDILEELILGNDIGWWVKLKRAAFIVMALFFRKDLVALILWYAHWKTGSMTSEVHEWMRNYQHLPKPR